MYVNAEWGYCALLISSPSVFVSLLKNCDVMWAGLRRQQFKPAQPLTNNKTPVKTCENQSGCKNPNLTIFNYLFQTKTCYPAVTSEESIHQSPSPLFLFVRKPTYLVIRWSSSLVSVERQLVTVGCSHGDDTNIPSPVPVSPFQILSELVLKI